MNIQTANQASSDERLWSALSHASILLFGWGIIAPVLVWISQRGKSSFAAFHALQATAYQLLLMIYTTALMILWVALLFLGIFLLAFLESGTNGETLPAAIFLLQALFFGGLFLCIGLYILLGLVGAALTLARREFRYPLLGTWIERYLETEAEGLPVPAGKVTV